MARERLPAARGFPTAGEIAAKRHPRRSGAGLIVTFDLSTTCVGWAVGPTTPGPLVNYGKIVFTDGRSMSEKLAGLDDFLRVILQTYRPAAVYVERPITQHGSVTATHNQVLGAVLLATYQYTRLIIPPAHLISPATIKKAMGVEKGRDHAHNKQKMVEHINTVCGLHLKYADSKFETDDDTADAIAVLLTVWTTLAQETPDA